jgi:hypothetical protein
MAASLCAFIVLLISLSSSGARPHPEFHGCFRWHLHLFSSGTAFLLFVHAADFFQTIHQDGKLANAVFLV